MENLQDSWLLHTFVAHRGFHNPENPENTLGAFKRAIEFNYAIECDLRLSKDGEIVILHDDSLSRMTGHDGYVSTLNYNEFKDFSVQNTEFKIPTLKELLKLVDGQVPILFDIKQTHIKSVGPLEQKLCEQLENYNGEFAVASSNPYVVLWFKENKPEFLRGIISSFYKNEEEGKQFVKSRIVRWLLKRMTLNKKSKPNFIMYYKSNLPNNYVKKSKLPVLAWTVSSQDELLNTLSVADNIIFEGFEPKI